MSVIHRVLCACVVVLGLFFVTGSAVCAQQADKADKKGEKKAKVPKRAEVELGEMVVTSSRREMILRESPDIVQVINRNEIDELNPGSVGEIIEYATGVSVETGTGSGLPKRSIVSLNGLPANYTLVLVDGKKLLSEHIHSGQNLESIHPAHIERIEVIRGAASAQYGSDALGGIVNIITRKCGDETDGQMGGSVGSYNTHQGHMSLLVPAGERVRITHFMNYEKSEGVDLKAPTHRLDNMGYSKFLLHERVDITVREATSVFASVNWVDNTMEWLDDTADSYLVAPVVGVNHFFSDSVDVHADFAYSKWHAETGGEDNILMEPEVYARWKINPGHSLLSGVNYRWNQFTRTAVDTRHQYSFGVFAQHEWLINEMFVLMTSLRVDKTEDVDAAVSPKASLLVNPRPWIRIRASISRGFHAPTVQELYEEGYGHRGRAYRFGNPDLDPEYSTAYTLGFEVKPIQRVKVMLYGFYNDVDDMIIPVYRGVWDQDPTIDVWERENIKNAEVYGFEIKSEIRLHQYVRLEAGYTYTDNEDKDTGRQLPYSPGKTLSARLAGWYPVTGLVDVSGFIGVKSAFDREAWSWKPATGAATNDPNGLITELEDFTKLDMGTSVKVARAYEIFAKVQNLLGEDIENLDDLHTVIDGKPVFTVGFNWELPF